jgi:hypothetical protein
VKRPVLNYFANRKTRRETTCLETVLVKRSLRPIVVCLSIATLITATDVAKAGPFRDFFRAIRSAIAHPKETPRPHRSKHKRNKTPPSDASTSRPPGNRTPAPPGQPEVRWAKAASIASSQKADLPYGTPVPGQPGLVNSPFAPDSGYVQVIGFPAGSAVEDPYTGKIFLTP